MPLKIDSTATTSRLEKTFSTKNAASSPLVRKAFTLAFQKMTDNPKVSIIIPVYNGERYIAQAIESALTQTYRKFEIIVVNDGSTDNSYEKIKPFLPSVKYIFQENQGVAAARNTAIKNSSGEFIAFLDQDDLWLPEKLELQVDYLLHNPDVGLVHSNMSYINEEGKSIQREFDFPSRIAGRCFGELFIKNKIAILTVLLRRDCLDKVGLFNVQFSGVDDYDLLLRVSRYYPVWHINQSLAGYRLHGSNTSRDWLGITLTRLRIIESLLETYPQIRSELGKKTVSDRLFQLYCEVARQHSHQNKHKAAIEYWKKAISVHPTKFSSYLEIIWSAITPNQRRVLNWYKYKIFHLCS
ncbi:MAG: glycosyltransferase [Deltaproteobacteria bacterium]|nr:glycosyltransferase [Deltaproteobacteria bacterium]